MSEQIYLSNLARGRTIKYVRVKILSLWRVRSHKFRCKTEMLLVDEQEKKKKSIENLKVIVEISCKTSPNHLIVVRKAYCSLFHSSLEEHIASSLPFEVAMLRED
ncbi:hypothetical protein ARALYDRAFT_901522 [Arabidopsis lyrata subsp. lyrata]|uniref:DUF223 domain-containing protein n=1 Tax=Arabidopsis lyrata subsp. lyrata TaxID=81972 RepID=D7LFG6_ARALL|nr:hypothetical protein ARALYDRAFT_901522 [Arabidopsis lyrata subsp. lyrata]